MWSPVNYEGSNLFMLLNTLSSIHSGSRQQAPSLPNDGGERPSNCSGGSATRAILGLHSVLGIREYQEYLEYSVFDVTW
jgi:hypothetical protein